MSLRDRQGAGSRNPGSDVGNDSPQQAPAEGQIDAVASGAATARRRTERVFRAAQEGRAADVRNLACALRAAGGSIDAGPARYQNRTPLWVAACNDHGGAVRELLAAGADPNAPFRFADAHTCFRFFTPLWGAAACGHVGIVRQLLQAKATTTAVCGHLRLSVLAAAAGHGDLDVVQALLLGKASVNHEGSNRILSPLANSASPDVSRALLRAKAEVCWFDTRGETALFKAARKGRDGVLRVLLEYKAVVCVCTGNGEGLTPLHVATSVQTTRLLLEARADPNQPDGIGRTPLSIAVAEARDSARARVLALLQGKADPNWREDCSNEVPLTCAANQQIALALLGAKAAARGARCVSPLAHAARRGWFGVVSALLRAKAAPDEYDRHRGTPLQTSSDDAIVELLMQAKVLAVGAAQTAAAAAAAGGARAAAAPLPLRAFARQSVHIVRPLLLLHAKAALDAADRDGHTALWLAAYFGNAAVVEALARAGACVDLAARDGNTPLVAAVNKRHESVVDALLRGKAEVNRLAAGGWSALCRAAVAGDADLVHQLLAAKARPGDDGSDDSDDGVSPLVEVAAASDDVAVLELLLQAKAHPNSRGARGPSALYHAANRGHSAVVARLLEASAGVDLLSFVGPRNDGELVTPLHAAVGMGHLSTVQTLLRAKASVDVGGRPRQRTPLHVAALCAQLEAARLLIQAKADVHRAAADGSAPWQLAEFGSPTRALVLAAGGEGGGGGGDNDQAPAKKRARLRWEE